MSTRAHSDSNDAIRGYFQLKPLVACMRVAITGGLLVGGAVPARAELPIPVPGQGWVSHGTASIDPTRSNDHNMVIDQKTGKAIYNWQKFNVGKDDTVNFDMPGSSSVALNRIFQDSPSKILGHITSDGKVYLVNKNGIVFGKDSVVDTKTLVATTLDISEEVFKRGIVRELEKDDGAGQAALNGQTGDANTEVNPTSSVEVEAGAKIHVDKNGQVILAAPTVTNAGSITADEKGQIILVASKDKVYLQPASSDSPFSGLLVEVGTGGKVENQAGGEIAVRQGNVTLAGFAVNQSGRLSSTTSVNVNGSIRLLAREKASDEVYLGKHKLVANSTVRADAKSEVKFGAGSSTDILADSDDATAYDEQVQKQSLVEVSGHNIAMEAGASIVAPHGKVNMTATNNLVDPLLGKSGRIQIDDAASIDVSGMKNVELGMDRNVAEISVQTYTLRDAPYQKGGVLQGAKVNVDNRKDTKILDASGGKSIKRGIEERLTEGGEINLTASGDVIVNSGAKFDISGGSVRYKDGYVNTTKLIEKSGRVVDISDANPEDAYVAVFGTVTEQHSKWAQSKNWNMLGSLLGRFEKGYTEGKDAGQLNIQSPKTAWGGQLIAGSERSLYQRNQPAFGGEFAINKVDNDGASREDLFLSAQNLGFQKDAPVVNAAFDATKSFDDLTGDADLLLSTDAIKASGISSLVVKSGGKASIDADVAVELPAFGELRIDASQIDVDGSVYAAGGSVQLNSIKDLNLHNGSELDVSGRWINDYQANIAGEANEIIVNNGGSVVVAAKENLSFTEAATIKADGGAWLNSSGRKLQAGDGGSIKLSAGKENITGQATVDGNLSAYGLNKGGKLTLASNNIAVGSDVDESGALNLQVHNGSFDLATELGFAELNLVANDGTLTVNGATDLALTTQNRVLDNDYQAKGSGKSIAEFSKVGQLEEHLRNPLKLGLSATHGVDIETGSRIVADKGSKIDIQTSNLGKGIFIDGTLEARGGTITALLKADKSIDHNPTQSIWVGSNAKLLTQGTTQLNPVDSSGRTTGEVLNGGSVSLEAKRGYVVLEKGSVVDISGTQAEMDIATAESTSGSPIYERKLIGSDAGKLTVKAAEGIVLDGDLSAQAGAGATVSRGGRLDVTLTRANRSPSEFGVFPLGPLVINVVDQAQTSLPSGMHSGSSIDSSLLGQATIASDAVEQAGFDDLRLAVEPQVSNNNLLDPGEIRFVGDVSLGLANSINLDAKTIGWKPASGQAGGTVKLDTAYLQLGSTGTNNAAVAMGQSVKGQGRLEANSQWTQLNGSALLTGFDSVKLNAAHDLRMVGVRHGSERAFTGELKTAANLDLQASQIYPSTLSDFKVTVSDPNGRIAISSSGNTDQTPLSAAGHLTLNAAEIQQDGVLKAPLGKIDLNASKRMSFGSGSVTSVSADGKTIPLGKIISNLWKYPLDGANYLVFNEGATSLTLGEKHLNVNAPEIEFNQDSVIDVSGGGDLLAAEFQPGLGGTVDYLSTTAKAKGGFAVLPALGDSVAPFDHNMSAGFNYAPGSSIYLSGDSGLPAGQYTILPPQYALLPGAYLVTPVANSRDQVANASTDFGLPIMSGYLLQSGSGSRDARSSGFLVENRDQVLKRSTYDLQTASAFFAKRAELNNVSIPLLPVDAGQVSIAAKSKLVLEGEFKVDAPKAKGAKMDIAADRIRVVDNLADAVPGELQILDDSLSNLQVDSLLLGGTRRINNQTGTTELSVTADEVTIDENAQLTMLDFIAAAKNDLTVEQGAKITSSGSVNTGDTAINVDGDGALLRVSVDKQVTLNRTGSPSGATGNLTVKQGARLEAAGKDHAAAKSMLFDASRSSTVNGDIVMDGGALSLTANTINLGETAGVQGNALNLSNDKLLSLTVDDLVLNSRGAINFYGNLGKENASGGFDALRFNNLVLDAAALSGYDNAGKTAKIQANSIELRNSQNYSVVAKGTGSGSLQLSANQLSQGNGSLAVNGFSQVGLTAAAANDQKQASQYSVKGDGQLDVDSNLTLTADALVAFDGHHLKINAADASGHQVNILGNGKNARKVTAGLGGSIEVDAGSINVRDVDVVLPSGGLKLTANDAHGDVTIDGESNIDLAGRALRFADKVVNSQGGVFAAEARQGNVLLGQNASLDVSSGGGLAKGGELIVKAQAGSVDLSGSIKAVKGSASVDMLKYADGSNFDALMTKFAQAGISDNLYFRLRNGAIVQSAGNDIHANHVDLVADNGDVDVSGKIVVDAAQQAGSVGLYAGGKVVLRDGSLISAKGGVNGGDVNLSSLANADATNGGIAVEAGSKIDVTGGDAASDGDVVLSARRTQNGINIQPIAGQVVGYKNFYAEGVAKYGNAELGNDGAIGQADLTKMMGDASSYIAAASQNVAALGAGIQLRPGIEIDYNGDLTLATAWDLAGARYGLANVPGTVTIRSTSNLNINRSLTDGYSGGALQEGESWSFRLVAGADTGSADRLATAGPGNLMLGTNTSVHTGTGDIQVVAGGNIEFADQSSTIYSGGRIDSDNPRGTLDGLHQTVSFDMLPYGDYPVAGGDLTLRAGKAIKGAVSNQFIDQWMYRQGWYDPGFDEGALTAWTVDASQFQQNVGSFGGGKVAISAQGNIDDLSVMLPTTGKQTGSSFADNVVSIGGGGALQVKAGGNISGGAYYLGKGQGEIIAGGQVKGSDSASQYAFAVGPQIVMSSDSSHPQTGKSQLTVAANNGVNLAGVSDAMMVSTLSANNPWQTHFFSYSASDEINVQSLSGDVHLNANVDAVANLLQVSSVEEKKLMSIYPASLNATAFNGSVQLDSDVVLYPSPTSTMNVFAKQEIRSADGKMYAMVMSDADPALLPGVSTRMAYADARSTELAQLFNPELLSGKNLNAAMHAAQPVHVGDKEPVRVVSQQGDISSIMLNLPKRAIIQAGRDLLNTPVQIQHVNSDDASVIAAGRDLRFIASLDENGNIAATGDTIKMEIAGPGRALIKTGRNMDLGSSVGLYTVGNQINTNLPAGGASLDLLIGLNEGKPDYAGFIVNYLRFEKADNGLVKDIYSGESIKVDDLKAYADALRGYQGDLPTRLSEYQDDAQQIKTLVVDFVHEQTANTNMTDAEAFVAFSKMSADEMTAIETKLKVAMDRVFFNELKTSGSASAADKFAGNAGGYAAIDTLFPGAKWAGDLSLFYSKIQTYAGGDINLMVPGGTVNAGLSVAPSGIGAKTPDELGIVVQEKGKINAYVKNDFIVNTSRTFSLGGGDILLWASEGDIDAGKGAKSALSVKVDQAYFDLEDQLVYPAPKITSGSGIRTTAPIGTVAGNVYLFAPKGVIDAGEAGIACNQCVFGAKAVANVGNIDIGKGGGIGVPSTAPTSVAAGFVGSNNVTSSVSQMAESSVGDEASKNANSLAKTLLGILSLDFLGFGD